MSRVKPQTNAIAHIPVRRDVPEGWSLSTVGECFFDIRNGTTASQNKQKRGFPVSRIETIQDGRFDLDRLRHIEKASAELLNVFAYKTGDIALSHINSFEHVGKTAIYEGKPKSLIHGMNLLRLRLGHEHLFAKYLYLFMQTDYFRWQVRDRVLHAVNQVSINQRSISQVSVLLAPIREQKRIVAKVEQLLARVNAARERLAKVPAILKRFRQSIFTAATSGKLTEGWREENPEVSSVLQTLQSLRGSKESTGRLPAQYENVEEEPNDIPHTWLRIQLGNILTDIKYGTSKKCNYEASGIPVFRIPNVVEGYIDHSDIKYAPLSEREYEKLRLKRGDILIIRSNGSVALVGKSALVTERETGFAYAGYLIRLRFDTHKVSPQYVNFVLSSYQTRVQIEVPARSTSGVHNINTEEVCRLSLPLPPLEEQEEIARQIKSLFRAADKIETRSKHAEALVDKLTQSILAKTFRGELVSTEAELARQEGREYEPASVLLERIKAEREALEEEKRIKKQVVSHRRRHRKPAKATATESKCSVTADTSESPKKKGGEIQGVVD